jgi:hypothetical protein
MSAPYLPGNARTTVEDVVSQKAVFNVGGYTTTANGASPEYPSEAEEAAPSFTDLNQMVDASSLAPEEKQSVKQTLVYLRSELFKQDETDVFLVQDNLRQVSAKLPMLRSRLRRWIEKTPGIADGVQDVVRAMFR